MIIKLVKCSSRKTLAGLFSFLFLFFLVSKVNCQPNIVQSLPTMPMSPNASSLAIYADYPVSHYTGIPKINIPLTEIDFDGFKLPISLNYHASGIKVSQED